MTDAVDRLPCSDVACALSGHVACGEILNPEALEAARRAGMTVQEFSDAFREFGSRLRSARPSVDDMAGTFAGPDSVEWLREQREGS